MIILDEILPFLAEISCSDVDIIMSIIGESNRCVYATLMFKGESSGTVATYVNVVIRSIAEVEPATLIPVITLAGDRH